MASLSQSPQYEPPQDSLPEGEEAQYLIALLDEARAYTLAVLGGADSTLIVHTGSGWTVRDVAGHILAWEQVALRAVQALESGAPAYTIPDFVSFDAVNVRLREQQRSLSFDDIRRELSEVRKQLKAVLTTLPAERFTNVFAFPWPGSGSLSKLVLIIAAHERGHAVEIGRSVSGAQQQHPSTS